jgi:hypothetical protein
MILTDAGFLIVLSGVGAQVSLMRTAAVQRVLEPVRHCCSDFCGRLNMYLCDGNWWVTIWAALGGKARCLGRLATAKLRSLRWTLGRYFALART